MSKDERHEIKSMADIYRSRGLYEQAADLYQLLITLEKSAPESDREDLGLLCYQLAEIYSSLGRFERARPFYQEAVRLWERRHPENALNWLWYLETLTKLEELSQAESSRNQTDSDIETA